MAFNRSLKVAIPCPKCKRNIPESIRRLETSPDLTCPNCGTVFRLDVEEFRKVLGKAEQQWGDLGRKLKGRNK